MNRRQFLQASVAASTLPSMTACGDGVTITIDTRLPVGPFGADSTAEEVTAGLDLNGKTVLITGCNSGVGYESMRVLALRGAHVIGTGRTLEKAQKACDSVVGHTTPVVLELSDFQSAVDCAASVAAMGVSIDSLILNAGIGSFAEFELINGIERIFVINYLGHVVLTQKLLPLLRATGGSRIVHVGSQQAYRAAPEVGIDFDNLRGEGEYSGSLAYGRSKLANALYSLKLSEILDPLQITSNVVHPGFVKTNIGRSASGIIKWLYQGAQSMIAKTPEQGAATQVYVATAPALAGVTGAYFEDCNPVTIEGDNHVFDKELADRLWDETRRILGDYLES